MSLEWHNTNEAESPDQVGRFYRQRHDSLWRMVANFADVDDGMGDPGRRGSHEPGMVELRWSATRESACFSSSGRTLTVDPLG